MIKDNLHFDAQEKLKAGIDKVSHAVGSTMGTGGNNSIIEAIESPGHLLTNDGYTIANSIVLSDPIEDMGRKILLESINRANKLSGDGSSTTCVLTSAIINEGLKHTKDHHPMDIKRSLEDCLPLIEENVEKNTQYIYKDDSLDLTRLEQVATISAEDETIGKTITEIYTKIGNKGLIYWDVSKTSEDSYTIGNGLTIDGAGYISPYMCDATESGQNTNQIRLKDPQILITKQKIVSASEFNEVAAQLFADEIKDLVVFADDFDPLVVPDLVKTRMVRGFRIIIVKMPTLWKDWWYEDLALATGAKIIDPSAGLPMKELKREHLGKCSNLIITKDETFIDGIQDVSKAIAEYEALDSDDGRLRASRLNTKTARYYVGAHSDSALSYRRLKVEDAIGAAYQALNGGIVAGGGVALSQCVDNFDDENVGQRILRQALHAPMAQIAINAGATPYLGCEKNIGLNSKTKEKVDMFEAGIVDPKNVVLNAIRNAISVAATVLTAPTIVTLPREEQPLNISQGNNNISVR